MALPAKHQRCQHACALNVKSVAADTGVSADFVEHFITCAPVAGAA
jgi:hypothetical protein